MIQYKYNLPEASPQFDGFCTTLKTLTTEYDSDCIKRMPAHATIPLCAPFSPLYARYPTHRAQVRIHNANRTIEAHNRQREPFGAPWPRSLGGDMISDHGLANCSYFRIPQRSRGAKRRSDIITPPRGGELRASRGFLGVRVSAREGFTGLRCSYPVTNLHPSWLPEQYHCTKRQLCQRNLADSSRKLQNS